MDAERMEVLELARGLAPTPKNIERLGKQVGEEVARWAFLQWELRDRGGAKFAKAGEMLFDRDALQMATHESIAAYHASRFPLKEPVADLTTGIGADLIALAARGPAIGFEVDAERMQLAIHNLRVHELTADLRLTDSAEADWDFGYAFADPARRDGARRTLKPEQFSPNPSALAERGRFLKLLGIKLSPLLPDLLLDGLGSKLEFVSFGGECREALVWTGLESDGGREAVHLESGERLSAQEGGASIAETASTFLFEADPAAIRAHCLPTLAELHGIELLADSNGYLTGPDPVISPWLRAYRVLADHAADERRTRTALAEVSSSTPIVKTRTPGIDVALVQRTFREKEGRPAILAIYASGKKLRHAVMIPTDI